MKLLFLGDIVGRSARDAIVADLPDLRARLGTDFVIVNGENAAGGFGITAQICNDLFDAGVDAVTLGNNRGETTLTAKLFDGVLRGVLIAESVHPNRSHIGGRGINMLTGAEAVAPVGGAAFHDNKVWIRKDAAEFQKQQ